jgi:rhodanese-related sulfurtransferase
MSMQKISMRELSLRISQFESTDLILDVRTPGEFSAGHIKGSMNLAHDQIANHLDQLRRFGRIYIHCRSGKRAQAAAQTLLAAGFTNLVCIADSGMDDWISAGLPVEKSSP